MIDRTKARTVAALFLTLLALTLFVSAFLTDEYVRSDIKKGDPSDADSDWWQVEITYGAREARMYIGLWDPYVPVALEKYNSTTATYADDLERGGEALTYGMAFGIASLVLALIAGIGVYIRFVPGYIQGTLAIIPLVIIFIGLLMYINALPPDPSGALMAEDGFTQEYLSADQRTEVSEAQDYGLSLYLTIAGLIILLPAPILVYSIRRQIKPSKGMMMEGFFREEKESADIPGKNLPTKEEERVERSRKKWFAKRETVEEEEEPQEETTWMKEPPGVRSGKL
ncbi:MAG: hypothetical protein ACMUIE_08945 [Thermoplasmatota archaeon]